VASYVYLLRHASDSCMKIGKADCVYSRASMLGLEKFDLSTSWAVRVPDATRAYDLEKALAKALKHHHVLRPNERDGRTEWYDVACFPRALQLVEQLADLFNAELLLGIEPPKAAVVPARVVPAPSRWSPRRRRPPPTEDELAAMCETARRQNQEALGDFLRALSAFRMIATVFSSTLKARNGKDLHLVFQSHPGTTFELVDMSLSALDPPYWLHLPHLSVRAAGEAFMCSVAPGSPGEHVIGHVTVRDPAFISLNGLVAEEPLGAYRATLAELDFCPKALEEQVEASQAASWRDLTKSALALPPDRRPRKASR
jgi:hypothetical protein